MYTLAAAAAGFSVDVFEPVPESALMMRKSLLRNSLQGQVRLFTSCLGDTVGAAPMVVSERNQGGVAHTRPKPKSVSKFLADHPFLEEEFFHLPVVRFDDVVHLPVGKPVYLKLDIEGGECAAVRGMRNFLEKSRIIGATVEMISSYECCRDQWLQPGGFFDVLLERHKLCPFALRGWGGRLVPDADPLTRLTLCSTGVHDIEWRRSCSAADGI